MAKFDVTVEGSVYEVDAPDENTAWRWANYEHNKLKTKEKPQTGFGAAFGKGVESTLSQLRSGIGGLFGTPEEAAQAGLERGKRLSEKYADQVSLEQVKKAYAEQGLLPAAVEVGRQAPLAIAEQAPNIATSKIGRAHV